MRIETTRSANAVRLEHAACFHGSHTDLLEQLVPLAEAALARDEPLATALQPETERALADRIGDRTRHWMTDDDGVVRLRRPDTTDGGPSGQTVAARWALELRALTSTTGRPVTVLSEHASALDGADGRFWTEFDAALNVALADLPVRITCFYPELPLYLEVVEGAQRNHPFLRADGELRHNPGHHDPRAVLAARPAARPPLLGPPDVRLSFSAWQLHDVRTSVERALTGRGYERERLEDIVLAVNELATNSIRHGGGSGVVRAWRESDTFVCEVCDSGRIDDPLAGRAAPDDVRHSGRGLWLVNQLCDLVQLRSRRDGCAVRLHVAYQPT